MTNLILVLFTFGFVWMTEAVVLYPYSNTICSGIQFQEHAFTFPLSELFPVVQNCKGDTHLKATNAHELDRYWMNHRNCHCWEYNICYNQTCYDQRMLFNVTAVVDFDEDDDEIGDETFYCNLMTPVLPPDLDDDWDEFHDGPYIIQINCTNEDNVNFIGDVTTPRTVSPNTEVPIVCTQVLPTPAGIPAPESYFTCHTSTTLVYCLNATLPVNVSTDVDRQSCTHSGAALSGPTFLALLSLLISLCYF
jgi:hypothetical protein